MECDEFEWDERKNAQNVKKHGVDFEDAVAIFDEFFLTRKDERFSYGEDRYIAIGVVGNQTLVVVYTLRGDACRIISARKASRNERSEYYKALERRPPDG